MPLDKKMFSLTMGGEIESNLPAIVILHETILFVHTPFNLYRSNDLYCSTRRRLAVDLRLGKRGY